MIIKKATLALIGGLTLAVLLPLTSSPAQASPATPTIDGYTSLAVAAVKCKGKSCTGKNPQIMGCENDAKTIG